MTPFTETLRHAHPIAPEDWVLEIGAHKGYDSAIFRKNYNCRVVAYEPCNFYYELAKRFADESGIFPVHCGACGDPEMRIETFGVHGDRSGQYAGTEKPERVMLAPICGIVRDWSDNFARPPALLQLNCEGGEYEILDALLRDKLVPTIPRIQVQFHSVVPDCRVRRDTIAEKMAVSHAPIWEPGDFDTGWVGWVRR